MSDLISKSELIKALREDKDNEFPLIFYHDDEFNEDLLDDLEEVISNQPTVEAATQIVICKDCINFNPKSHVCMSLYLSGQVIEDGYCYNGMRRPK